MESFERHFSEDLPDENPRHIPIDDESNLPAYLAEEYKEQDVSLPELRERTFRLVVDCQLVDEFKDAMSEADFSEKEIERSVDIIGSLSEEQIDRVLSYPKELRARILEKYQERMNEGEFEPEEMIRDLQSRAEEHGFSIGFHTSNRDIQPDENGAWNIRGIEPDHRDGDVGMAYYSTYYEALYKRKDPTYIYVVRANTKEHKTDGRWSRAPQLSIISRMSMHNVMQQVEYITKEALEQSQNKQQK